MRTETFALFFGIAYLSAGLLGLHPAALMPPPADAPPMRLTSLYGYLLGVFPVNLPLSAVHVAIGAWGILAWRRVTNPRVFAGALAIFCSALAVAGLIPRLDTLFGMLPLHGNNVWLHVGTAAVAAYFALHAELSVEHRASNAFDRREQVVSVASERRHGHADRRLPAAGEEI
jgi:hypothetical protein